MPQSDIKLDHFDDLVVRVANLPVQNFNKHKDDIIRFYKENGLLQLAIIIASKSLYDDIEKEKISKYKNSLNKYFNRIHFNPVPFGLFSSVGISKYSEYHTTILKRGNEYLLDVLWDHHFLAKLRYEKKDINFVKEYIYYTNPTLSKYFSDKINFVKTNLSKEGVLHEEYVSVDNDENFSWLINFFKTGKTTLDFKEELTKSGFEENEINEFLSQVIETGVIIDDFTYYPYENSKNKIFEKNYSFIGHKMISTENEIRDFKNNYLNSLSEVKQDFETENKNYFSITSFYNESGHIDSNIKKKIEQYILFTIALNKDYTPIKDRLQKFGNDYYHSFCDGYTPLSKVFNLNYGIEYNDKPSSIQENNKLVSAKILEQVLSNKDKVCLNLKDFVNDSTFSRVQLPPTFGVMYELLKCKNTGKDIIFVKSIGGASALPMLARFKTKTGKLCKDIATFEASQYSNSVLAEINYLPQIRAKNIFAREHYYDYSIAINTCQTENNIELDDLYINFDGNRFNIFSKTLEKNVIPKITSAIDYSYCDNDLYKFLCDLQYQEGELYRVNFDFNNQQNIFTEYIPRIFLEENILLSPSQMLLTAGNYLNFDEFKFKLLLQLKSFNFSNTILIPDKKGYLVHGTSDEELIILYKLLLEKRYFFIKEHIYDSYQPIMQDSLNQSYCHEIISCVKNKNIREIVNNDIFLQHIDYDSNSPLISDWFFIELYCKKGSENEILTHYENNLNKCDLFFFVRYNYPKNHIRLRIKTSNIDIIKENIELSEFLKKEFAIIDYKICPYNQELTRYGGKSIMQITEYLFHTDTKDYLENFVFNKTESDPILYAINKVLCYFKKFNFTLNNMIEVCDINVLSFSNEFKFDQGIRKAFNKEYSEIKNKIFFNNNLLSNLEINNETLNEIDNLYKYISDVIHMGLNRSFESKQRFNEFKTYYFTKLYLNRIKFNK